MGMSLAPLAGMRCQFCQQPISLLRRLSDPTFCSAKHREQYEQQQAALAIARLQPVVRQAGSRARAAKEPPTAVAVLEPVEPPKSATLAGVVPCPPQQTRQYWCFALPSEPISPPVGVMLRETSSRWPILEPAWATSVVAMWPVDRRCPTETGKPVAPASVAFALPASPLLPLRWIDSGTQSIPDAFESLIPLSILPAWSLPQRGQEDSTADAFRVAPLLPTVSFSACPSFVAALAVAVGPLRSVKPPLLFAATQDEPVSILGTTPWMPGGTIPFGYGNLRQEWQGYVSRMERQLIQVAEQAGLCARIANSLPTPRLALPEIRDTTGHFPFEVCRSLPSPSGHFALPAIHWGGALPVPGPVNQSIGQSIGSPPRTDDPLPLAGVPALQWPQQPTQTVSGLPLSEGVAWVAVPPAIAAIRLAPFEAEPNHAVTRCWPTSHLASRALPHSERLARPPEPVALPALAGTNQPNATMAAPSIALLFPEVHFNRTAPELSVLVPLSLPAPQPPVGHAGAELTPHPGRPSVIVPASAGTVQTRSSTRQQTLFPLTHLFPTRRDQIARNSSIASCPWRGKPVLPPTRLPRISLQERNATRASALQEVRQVLQQQTIDRARRFWKLAPADLKWLALALPLILGVWLWPRKAVSVSVPSPVGFVKTTAKAASGNSYLEKVFQSNVNLGGFEERIARRSSIHLEEDFSAGLSMWEGDGNWARSWYYDKSGVVRPGRMAIYQPSIPMEDYQFVLTAAVERRSISWMVRATNLRNYVAARLNIAGSGSDQRLSFERWTVKDGRVTRRQVLPLGTTLGTATTARIRMEVVGNTFTTTLQDQVIDVFTDSSHATGGVGLFSSDGDQPRIYRLELTHQHDFFGKLCSFLAPHPITKAGTIRP